MCSRTCALLLGSRFLIVSLVYYSVALNVNWVSTDTHNWSLYRRCDVNITFWKGKIKVACHTLYPGDSPVCYEVVRWCALVSAVLVLVYVFVIWCHLIRNHSDSVGPPNIVALFYCVSAATALVLLPVNLKTDDRWKDSNPALGFGYWMACGSAGFNLVFFLLFATSRRDTPRQFEPKRRYQCCCVSAGPDLPTITRRASNASCLTIDKGKKITIFHSSTPQTTIPSAIQMNPRESSTNPCDPSTKPRGDFSTKL